MKKFTSIFLSILMLMSTVNFTALAQTTERKGSKDTTSLSESEIKSSEETKSSEDTKAISLEDSISTLSDVDGVLADDNLKLQYIVVTKPTVEFDEGSDSATQQICVGLGDGSVTVESAELIYNKLASKESETVTATSISAQGALNFDINFTMADKGTYVISHIRYTVSGTSYLLKLSDAGVKEVAFGVGNTVETQPDAYTVDENNEDTSSTDAVSNEVKMSIARADGKGGFIEDEDIDSAIDNSASKLLNARSLKADPTTGEKVVVLDPGHGGGQPGAVKFGTSEKDINLKIARYCKEELEQYSGVKVYMTREGDETLSLQQRADFAARVKADLFVSLHCNSSVNSTSQGAEVYYPNSASYNNYTHEQGANVSQKILDQLVALGLANRGSQIRNSTDGETYDGGDTADYYGVISKTRRYGITGIIVEHAFMSNQSDFDNFLSSDDKLQRLGVADATGIAQYFGLNKDNYSYVFDINYYWGRYGREFEQNGLTIAGAYSHFLQWGMNEGRQAISTFDPGYYRNNNKDLNDTFGNDWRRYYEHFIDNGIKEGRQGSGEFYVNIYMLNYWDLQQAFGSDPVKYYEHYLSSVVRGSETRNGKTQEHVYFRRKGEDSKINRDYTSLFDYKYYYKNNGDLWEHCGLNAYALLEHFVDNGFGEGRWGNAENTANKNFDVNLYRINNEDISKFAGDVKGCSKHYIEWGLFEGRTANEQVAAWYNGINYNSIFDYKYYHNTYVDLQDAFGLNAYKLLEHFVNGGFGEGRWGNAENTANKNFDVNLYRINYADLQNAFGDDIGRYTAHYIGGGFAEGRTANEQVAAWYNGKNYHDEFNYQSYYDQYKEREDIKAIGLNAYELLKHYVTVIREKDTNTSDDMNIMGTSRVTAADLAEYYRKNSTAYTYQQYLDKVNSSGRYNEAAKSLEEFCQIYYEECAIEGVRVEVAFAQMIIETGWLKFQGAVGVEKFNFAGIGAIDSNPGEAHKFNNAREGIRAQVQHLKAYASTEALKQECVDPRFNLVIRGSATTVKSLAGKWASDSNYGTKLMQKINGILAYASLRDYSYVFDASYYLEKQTDVKSAGYTIANVHEHFLEWGLKEGRQAISTFDPGYYRTNNADLNSAFGNDMKRYYEHFIDNGIRENRQGSGEFYVNTYMLNYWDLQQAFGSDPVKYYEHYLSSVVRGSETRNGKTQEHVYFRRKGEDSKINRDYTSLFDYKYYYNHEKNGDLREHCGLNAYALLEHFVDNGFGEGRLGNAENTANKNFDVNLYRINNEDISKFAGDVKGCSKHYIEWGLFEGRIANEQVAAWYNGINYNSIFDYKYYYEAHGDLQIAIGLNAYRLLEHFVNGGFGEGRYGKEGIKFDANVYRINYADLQNAFGDDIGRYTAHYIGDGVKEGRTANKQVAAWYNGINYNSIFDYKYYYEAHGDLQIAIGLNAYRLLDHFVSWGIGEGRYGREGIKFDANVYRINYADLQNAFGDDIGRYTAHYIGDGVKEGRTANEQVAAWYNGDNYHEEFDYLYYYNRYKDTREDIKAIGLNAYELLEHYVTNRN